MRRPKSPAIIIMLCAMLFVAVGAVAYIAAHARSAWRSLPQVLSSVVSERVDGKFTVGKVDVSPTGIIFHNVKLTSDADGEKRLLDAEQVKVGMRLMDLIRDRKDPILAVDSVEIVRPTAFIERGADGRWNIAGILKPTEPTQPKFRGRVTITGGTVSLLDRKPAGGARRNDLRNVSAFIDFADPSVPDYRVTADGPRGRMGKLSARGKYHLDSRSISADIDGLDADAAYWTKYPFDLKFMNVTSGRADLRMHIVRSGERKPIRYSGEFLVSDSAVQFKWLRRPVRSVDGSVSIKNDLAILALRGQVDSTPIEVSGRVIGFKGSKLALDLQTNRANFREIGRALKVAIPRGMVVPTTGRAHVSISGPTKNISAVFKADAPMLSYNQFSGRSIHAEGTYSGKRVIIRNATGRAYGGSVTAYGEFGWGYRKAISFQGSASGIRVSQFPATRGKGIDAITSGHFGFEWSASKKDITYRGTLTGGTYQKYRFDRGAIGLSYGGGKVHLDEISAEIFGGKVAASGDISADGDLDLEVSGAGINLAAVQGLLWKTPTVGKVQFDGRLTGTTESPTFDGQLEAYSVMVNGVGVEHVSADMEATRKQIHLRELAAEDPSGTVTISGDVTNPFSTMPRLDLALGIQNLDVERWAIVSGLSFQITGTLSADLKVTQTLYNPDIQGRLQIEKGRVADLPIDSLDMNAVYRKNELTLSGLEAHSGDGVITADGKVSFSDGDIGLSFGARNMPIAALTASMKDYVLISGDVNAQGEVSGTVEETIVKATIGSDNPKINGQSFGKFEAKASWTDAKLQMGKISLTDDKAEYSVSDLTYSPDDQRIDLSGQIKDALVERVIALIDRGPKSRATAALRGRLASIPRPFRGVLNSTVKGSISLAGEKVTPDLSFSGDVSKVTIGPSEISQVKLEGGFENGTFKLSELKALDGNTDLVASVSIGSKGEMDVRVDAHGVDLGLATKWFKLNQNFSGSADVTIIAGGTTAAPAVEASFDIQNPVIEGRKFDGLRARFSAQPLGEGGAAGNRINIDDLTIVLGDSQLSAAGYVPIDWTTYTIPRDKELLLEVLVDDDSLKMLSALSGGILVGDAGGTIAGKISYGGTINNPQLGGGLKWREGRAQLARLKKPFDQIEADVTLSGRTISIDRLVGKSTEGGSFKVSGPIDLVEPEAGQDISRASSLIDLLAMKTKLGLSLTTSGLKVSGRNISGKYGENIDATFDSDLRVTGEWRTPLLAGTVAIPKGSVGLTGSPDEANPAISSSFDPRFDLKVTIGRGLVLKSARLEAALPGTLSIGGSLKAPIVDGLINLADGTILFPMRAFRLMPGSDMRIRMSPGQPVLVLLDVKARGKVVDMSPLGKRTKYDVVMEATGPLDKLRPTFTSSPVGLPEQRIIALVTGQYQFEQILRGSEGQDVGKQLSGLFSSAVLPSVFAPIEDAFKEAFGIDEFALEMGYDEPVQLSIGDQLGDKTYISYSAAIGARPDYADSRYQLKLSYRIKDNLEIGVHTDENRELGITAEGKIRF